MVGWKEYMSREERMPDASGILIGTLWARSVFLKPSTADVSAE